MDRKIGFIGLGNMASAIIGGILESKLVDKENIIGSARTENTINRMEREFGIKVTKDNVELAKESDIIFLAIKPYLYDEVVDQIKDHIKDNAILIIIAAGKSIKSIEKRFDRKVKVIRTMPNTPAMVREGMTAITFNVEITDADKEYILKIFKSFGEVELVEEELYHAVTGTSGSSPAYVYMFIEALADGAVLEGLPRDKAYKLAAQSVLGAAKMVLETGMHPGELKDRVCSPGGTTIEAVSKLEEKGFRDAIISAVRVCAEKSKEMSK